jgi:hypothetical protein
MNLQIYLALAKSKVYCFLIFFSDFFKQNLKQTEICKNTFYKDQHKLGKITIQTSVLELSYCKLHKI